MLEQATLDWYCAINRESAEMVDMIFLSTLFRRRLKRMTDVPEFWEQDPAEAEEQYKKLVRACTLRGDSRWTIDDVFNPTLKEA